MKNKTFTFYADAGHAWLKVTLRDAKKIGLSYKDFSEYSYWQPLKSGPCLYLEEDGDAGTFLHKFRETYGKFPKLKNTYCEYSSIRKLARIEKQKNRRGFT